MQELQIKLELHGARKLAALIEAVEPFQGCDDPEVAWAAMVAQMLYRRKYADLCKPDTTKLKLWPGEAMALHLILKRVSVDCTGISFVRSMMVQLDPWVQNERGKLQARYGAKVHGQDNIPLKGFLKQSPMLG